MPQGGGRTFYLWGGLCKQYACITRPLWSSIRGSRTTLEPVEPEPADLVGWHENRTLFGVTVGGRPPHRLLAFYAACPDLVWIS